MPFFARSNPLVGKLWEATMLSRFSATSSHLEISSMTMVRRGMIMGSPCMSSVVITSFRARGESSRMATPHFS